MKKTLLTLLAVCVSLLLKAQCNAFFPMKEITKYEYEHFDKKEKLALRTTQTLKNVSGSGDNMVATMVQEIIDVKKGDIISTAESDWSCEGGTLHFTVSNVNMNIDNQQMYASGMKAEVTGDQMDIPSEFHVGQTLKDISYQFKMSMNGMNLMNRKYTIKDRKVESQESVTTPAGTFDCYKVTFMTTGEGGLGGGTIKSIMWYAKNVGLVKTENFKEDGKFMGRQVLSKIK